MKKRTIVFGYPAFVVWRSILAGFLFVIVLIGVLVGLAYMALSEMLSSINSSTQQGVSFYKYWMVVLGVFIVWWWLSRGSRRFARRWKNSTGGYALRAAMRLLRGAKSVHAVAHNGRSMDSTNDGENLRIIREARMAMCEGAYFIK